MPPDESHAPLLSLPRAGNHQDLPPFPTRRSSDLPTDTPVEINAVAFRDLSRRKPIVPAGYPPSPPATAGVMAGDRLYLSRSEEHTSELQSRLHFVCRLLLEKNN